MLNKIYERRLEYTALWKKGTTLVVGDSMLYGIDETRLRSTKVSIFPGSTIKDMHFNIYPVLHKDPTNIFLVIGTNNIDNSVQIAEKLSKLREYILSIIPSCLVIISSLINRYDHTKDQLTVVTKTNELKMS